MFVVHLLDDTHKGFEHLYYDTKEEAWTSAKELAMSSAEREFYKASSWPEQDRSPKILYNRDGLVVQNADGHTVIEFVIEEIVSEKSEGDGTPDITHEELKRLVDSIENLYCYLCDRSDLEPSDIIDRYVSLTAEDTEKFRQYGLYFISTDMKDYAASRSADTVKE